MKPWKIEIRPTETGFQVKSVSHLRDQQARLMVAYIEKCLADLAEVPTKAKKPAKQK